MRLIERLVPSGTPPRVATADASAWLDRDLAELRPVVVLACGLLTTPRWYAATAAALRERGAAEVLIPPVYMQDWVLASVRGLGPIVTRSARTLLEACARAAAQPATAGAPILWVGHSAGGLVGRLLTSPVPFEGRMLNASARIAAIVTLGTPHVISDRERWGRHVSDAATRFADRHVPGAWFAPAVGYVAVGSRAIVGRQDAPDGRGRFAWRLYADLVTPGDQEEIAGDGLVPLASALLPGARHVVLDGTTHGPGARDDWYGRGPALDAWWPVALEVWRDALRARQTLPAR